MIPKGHLGDRESPPVPRSWIYHRNTSPCRSRSRSRSSQSYGSPVGMFPVNTLAHAVRIPPAGTGLAQDPGKPCLVVEGSSGCGWEGPKKRA